VEAAEAVIIHLQVPAVLGADHQVKMDRSLALQTLLPQIPVAARAVAAIVLNKTAQVPAARE
jgi:hypothetical protein